ncbi:MAG: hypothetical protein COB67_06540 [SAR324 cluster bacterium]|uniref:Long-chain fatty acid transporter n=1 Tax=SAR324 cluster bacterium TaxID=2024889 RepID=A0A2A4T4P6_9DELT|nr:MAG: hypothetical protein COB67_06540 [SAR324 cluster bacterium]
MQLKQLGLSLVSLMAGTGFAWGNGFHSTLSDAASNGMATAGITRMEAATTATDLPAAMPFLEKGVHALGGIARVSSEFEFTNESTGAKAETETPTILGPHLFGVWGNEKFAFGISQTFPFNSGVKWPEDWSGKQVLTELELTIGNTSPVVAFRMGNFGIAAGMDLYDGKITLKKTASYGFDVPVELSGTGKAMGYNASFFYNGDNFAFGVAHHSKFVLDGKGTADFDSSGAPNAPTQAFVDGLLPYGDIDVDLQLPAVTRFGISYKDKKRNPDVFIELTATKTDWSHFENLTVDFESNGSSSVIAKDWQDTVGYQLGATFVVSRSSENTVKVRVGAALDPSPIPEETLDPLTPDTGRTTYAAGLGIVHGDLIWDISYLNVTTKKASSTYSALSGDYEGGAQSIATSFGYHW